MDKDKETGEAAENLSSPKKKQPKHCCKKLVDGIYVLFHYLRCLYQVESAFHYAMKIKSEDNLLQCYDVMKKIQSIIEDYLILLSKIIQEKKVEHSMDTDFNDLLLEMFQERHGKSEVQVTVALTKRIIAAVADKKEDVLAIGREQLFPLVNWLEPPAGAA